MPPIRRHASACMALTALTVIAACHSSVLAEDKVKIPVPSGLLDDALDAQTWADYPGSVTEKRPAGYEKAEFLWWHEINGTQCWEDPTLIRIADDGSETYIDPATGKQTTTKPVEAAWLTLWDDESNMEYFHNTITKETSWQLPHILAWQKLYVDSEGNVALPPEEADDEGAEGPWQDDDEGEWHDSDDEDLGEESGEEAHAETEAFMEDQAEAAKVDNTALESNGDREEAVAHSDL